MNLQDRDRIIKKIVQNPNMSKKEIDKEAGITNPRSGARETELFMPWIEENTYLVFGESITWHSVGLHNMRYTKIDPDLVGKDATGCSVIVEVKFKFDFPGDRNHLRSDVEHKSIGQILQYLTAYMRKYPSDQIPRLFIVSIDYSPEVDEVCLFLQECGIDIKHIAIENILPK